MKTLNPASPSDGRISHGTMTAYSPAYITHLLDGNSRRAAVMPATADMMMMDMMMCSRHEPDAGHRLP